MHFHLLLQGGSSPTAQPHNAVATNVKEFATGTASVRSKSNRIHNDSELYAINGSTNTGQMNCSGTQHENDNT